MIPADPGTYILTLRCDGTGTIRVGRLGSISLRPGYYLYIGSAFGPGGLRARIGHHGRKSVRPHWHIDYLRRHTTLESVAYGCGARCEHEWAARIGAAPGAAMVLRGFGSSDCSCETHLFRFDEAPSLAGFGEGLGASLAAYANNSFTTVPWTSVRRKSRP